MSWMVQQAVHKGELERILPGTYTAAGAVTLQAKAVALSRRHPDAVIAGRAAAALIWWPELRTPTLEAITRHHLAPARGFTWRRGTVLPELIVETNRIRLTAPALTVLDLIPELGGEVVDEALRRRVVTLPQLWDTLSLTPQRVGNGERRRLLDDSRDEPWSAAERRLHRLYRGLDLPWRYRTNLRVALAHGAAFLDLAIEELKLGFEVDGREHHTSATAFTRDRTRDPELTELGWVIVRFAATTVEDDPAWVEARLRGIIAGRAAELGLPQPANREAKSGTAANSSAWSDAGRATMSSARSRPALAMRRGRPDSALPQSSVAANTDVGETTAFR